MRALVCLVSGHGLTILTPFWGCPSSLHDSGSLPPPVPNFPFEKQRKGGISQLRIGGPPDTTTAGTSHIWAVGRPAWSGGGGLGSPRHAFPAHSHHRLPLPGSQPARGPPLCSPCTEPGGSSFTMTSGLHCVLLPQPASGRTRGLPCSQPGGTSPLLLTSPRPDCQEAGNAGAPVVSQESSRRQTRRRDSGRPAALQGQHRASCTAPAAATTAGLWRGRHTSAAVPSLCSQGSPPSRHSPSALPAPPPGPVHQLLPLGERPPQISEPGRCKPSPRCHPFVVPSSPSHLKVQPLRPPRCAGLSIPLTCELQDHRPACHTQNTAHTRPPLRKQLFQE